MNDEIKQLDEEERELQPDISRAQRANIILNDDMVVAALADIEAATLETIRTSDPEDVDRREDAYRMIRVVKMFKSTFDAHIRNGEMAGILTEEIKTKRKTILERMRQWA